MAPETEVLSSLLQWLQQGREAFLCTVASTWGSSPRPVGSLMACTRDGLQRGSLSGGCVEDALLAALASGELVTDGQPAFIRYGETEEEQQRLQLPCGGVLGVLVEPVLPGAHFHRVLPELLTALEQRQCVLRDYDYATRHFSIAVPEKGGVHPSLSLITPLCEISGKHRIRQLYGPCFHLFLIGVSEVSRAVARFALQMDYRVTLCDPRPERIEQWDVPDVETCCAMPDEALLVRANDPRSAILALAHDPRVDDMGLMAAFETEAFFIGAMGSLRTSAARRERLLQLGVSAQQLERLHAPVGIHNGSKTPVEIAVSILAQLSAVRSGLVV